MLSSRSYTSLAVFVLLAGVADVPGAECFTPQKLRLSNGMFEI